MLTSLKDRVDEAARMLDFVDPTWPSKAQPDELDMSLCTTDLIAQLTGNQSTMDYEPDAYRVLVYTGNLPDEDEDFDELTAAWREQISRRVA